MRKSGIVTILHIIENSFAIFSLCCITLLPALEVFTRKALSTGVFGSAEYVIHLVLWITYAGGLITSRENKHLALQISLNLFKGKVKRMIRTLSAMVSVAVCAGFAWSAFEFIRLGFDPSTKVGLLPIGFVTWIMPIGYALMGLRFIIQSPPHWSYKTIAAFGGIGMALLLGFVLTDYFSFLVWPLAAGLLIMAFLGTPLFVVLGGMGTLFFLNTGGTTVVLANEAYTMLTSPILPTIPLFTLAGFILSEGKAGERLIRLFRALFGWLPGGLAIVTILICTFFTALTGASGVTILALGGVLYYVLTESKYHENFAIGLLTVNGIGSLFPPSLPIIMFGVIAGIGIKEMFAGVLLPCSVMVLFLITYSVYTASKKKIERVPFKVDELWPAVRGAITEILLPVIILVLFFAGFTTLVETGAVSVLYVLFTQTLIHKDLNIKGVFQAFLKSLPIMGGVLVILAASKGLSYFIVDQQIPMILTDWLQKYVQSKYLFLLLLNVVLLFAGCLMDVFSAIIVIVPLIVPLGEAYGIHPVHLGVIFLANLEVGYLTPPVGINLFLASYRFNVPLTKIYKDVIPFFIIMILSVLAITYIPWFTTALPTLFGY